MQIRTWIGKFNRTPTAVQDLPPNARKAQADVRSHNHALLLFLLLAFPFSLPDFALILFLLFGVLMPVLLPCLASQLLLRTAFAGIRLVLLGTATSKCSMSMLYIKRLAEVRSMGTLPMTCVLARA